MNKDCNPLVLPIALGLFIAALHFMHIPAFGSNGFQRLPNVNSMPVRTHTELCQEVEYELLRSVSDELLTLNDARSLVERCYRLFVR